MSDDPTPPGGFCGTARLFPLPNLVLFPSVVQPLHIFEPRYRQLMDDALADDRLIGMALLRPGWEPDYDKASPIYPVVCLGRVFQEQRLADGRWNLLLHGLARARVEEELQTGKLYRSARVRSLADADVASAEEAGRLRRELGRGMEGWLAAQPAALGQLEKLMGSALPLGALCDVFAFALPLDVALKQQLLEDADVGERTRRLIAHLRENAPADAAPPPGRKFPPEFSPN
jgi:Lon protease-like protein